jgi:hypothetical protein
MALMFNNVTPGLWLFLLSSFVTYFPYWFVLHRYEKEPTNFPEDRKFLFLYFLQMAWFFINVIFVILLWVFFAKGDLSQILAVLSIFFPSISLPSAIMSAITGVYPALERKGYFYYENYKSSSEQIFVATDGPQLKTVGWLQFILITVLIGVSLVYVLR